MVSKFGKMIKIFKMVKMALEKSKDEKMKLFGNPINFKRPEMPSDIIWDRENTGMSAKQKFSRKIIVLIGLLFIMFISYRAQIRLK